MILNDKKIAAKAIIIYSALLMVVGVIYPPLFMWVLFGSIVVASIITLLIGRQEYKNNKEIDDEIEYDGNGY